MDFFELSKNTEVRKVVPKNTFNSYINTKQKKLLTEKVIRITWTHKLSKLTTNLDTSEIEEIQIFKIELKTEEKIPGIIGIIDKAIPYPIIFIIQFEDKNYFSISVKHPHPINENNAVVDWTFDSEWQENSNNPFSIKLKGNLDSVYKDFCFQLSGRKGKQNLSMDKMVDFYQKKHTLESEIKKLKQKILQSKQFNEKVALNLVLNNKKKELALFTSK